MGRNDRPRARRPSRHPLRAQASAERAQAIAAEVARILAADAAVFRALLAQYSATGRAFAGDPTSELVACLRTAAEQGTIDRDAKVRHLGELLAAGLLGVIQQWATGLISDRELKRRAVDMVDLVFAAARRGWGARRAKNPAFTGFPSAPERTRQKVGIVGGSTGANWQ